jgi:Family of unknown function (DUF6011)
MAEMIRCGHCKERHETVAEVRNCSEQGVASTRLDGGSPNLTAAYDRETARRKAVAATHPRSGGGGTIQTSSNGILSQLRSYNQRQIDEDQRAMDEVTRQAEIREAEVIAAYKAGAADFSPARNLDEQRARQMDFTGGSKQSPREVRPSTTGFPEVPEGHYAIERDGVLKFYKVDHGRPGTRWDGYVFLAVQASDDYHPIKNREIKQQILSGIAKDLEEAMTRYGQEIGRCGRCHRTLTDAESRAYGIGPDCRGKLGW